VISGVYVFATSYTATIRPNHMGHILFKRLASAEKLAGQSVVPLLHFS